ncbi:hypothetical protein STEG23_012342, partial [Scotinomys teguina]
MEVDDQFQDAEKPKQNQTDGEKRFDTGYQDMEKEKEFDSLLRKHVNCGPKLKWAGRSPAEDWEGLERELCADDMMGKIFYNKHLIPPTHTTHPHHSSKRIRPPMESQQSLIHSVEAGPSPYTCIKACGDYDEMQGTSDYTRADSAEPLTHLHIKGT